VSPSSSERSFGVWTASELRYKLKQAEVERDAAIARAEVAERAARHWGVKTNRVEAERDEYQRQAAACVAIQASESAALAAARLEIGRLQTELGNANKWWQFWYEQSDEGKRNREDAAALAALSQEGKL
jgi:hypothetical protein